MEICLGLALGAVPCTCLAAAQAPPGYAVFIDDLGIPILDIDGQLILVPLYYFK